MKYSFLITGLLRQFPKNLYPFLCELEKYIDFDLYIYTSRSNLDTNYLATHSPTLYEPLFSNPRCKLLTFDNSILDIAVNLRERDKNIYYQWHKLYKCFQYISKDTYDFIVRIRPDICMLISAKAFADILTSLDTSAIYIPEGNDRLNSNGINDQFAIGNYRLMEKYCNTFNTLLAYERESPLLSEKVLYSHLQKENVPIQRINIPYSINLSECIVLAITGDSGSGKSTILEAIQTIFPFDSKLVLETDRYHKWERNDAQWSSITHLNPEANHLEKLIDDTFHLKMGNTVCSVDYDHTTGKFTTPQIITPKNFLLLCGLHTLYKEKLRNEIDIKIYIDTEETLKTYWKIRRDLTKRQHDTEKILQIIEKRKQDFHQYIDPQKDFANLVFKYWYDLPIPAYTDELDPAHIRFGIECKISLLSYISQILYFFSSQHKQTRNDTIFFEIKSNISKNDIIHFITQHSILTESQELIKDSYLGIVQLIILRLLLT